MKAGSQRNRQTLLQRADFVVLEEGIVALALHLSAEQHEQLFQYALLIQKWNQVYNLTAIRDAKSIITHHLLDSLSVVSVMKQALQKKTNPRILDVGAGAGLPGVVLAIACPEWELTLVDTVQKKAVFMQQAIGSLGLFNAKAIHVRVEELSVPPFDVICSRAFSSIEKLIQLSGHLLLPSGFFAALKGKVEVDNQVPMDWSVDSLHWIKVPFLQEDRHLFVVRKNNLII
jgi:16S rRNA (guanine527-N7)-methyltransferase